MFNMKTLIFFVLTLSLTGCVTWYKPGARQGEFEQAKYQCLQESQQRVGVAQVNPYGGTAVNSVQTNDMLFGNCMNAKGWSLQNTKALESQLQQQEANNSVVQAQIESDKSRINSMGIEMCANPELKAYYSKTACKVQDVTFEQLADSTKITAPQKAALVKQRAIVDKLQKEQAKAMRSTPSPNDKKVADLYESIIVTQGNQINLDLYNGKITWGEFNQKRKDILSNYQSAIKNVTGR